MKNGKLNLALNVAILISGNGTTMEKVIRACKEYRLPHVNPVLVIASAFGVGGIEKARTRGIADKDIVVLNPKEFEDTEAFGEAILFECGVRGVDLIVQCGWIPRTPSNVIAAYEQWIINQHPGPLDQSRPGFGGKGMHGRSVHAAVIHFAKRVGRPFRTEATVHRVIDAMDQGPILGMRPVEILADDDAIRLAERVLPYEHALVIEIIGQFSEFDGAYEIVRGYPLINEHEKDLLSEAKEVGIKAFPNG